MTLYKTRDRSEHLKQGLEKSIPSVTSLHCTSVSPICTTNSSSQTDLS